MRRSSAAQSGFLQSLGSCVCLLRCVCLFVMGFARFVWVRCLIGFVCLFVIDRQRAMRAIREIGVKSDARSQEVRYI